MTVVDKTYSRYEVVDMLVNNMQAVMKLIDNKYYVANFEKEMVYCYQKRIIFGDELLSSYTFDYIIEEAGGEV